MQFFLADCPSTVLQVYDAYLGLREQDWKVLDATRGQLSSLLRNASSNVESRSAL